MKRWELLGEAHEGADVHYSLHRHDGNYVIRVNGADLMSTRQHASEDRLAELVCGPLASAKSPRVLVGGLGFGFTARRALALLGKGARVTVAEISPAIVEWNRQREFGLAADVLDDPRTELVLGDVLQLMQARSGEFDGIMLDVDNGPEAMSTPANRALYQEMGLFSAMSALRPGGCAGYWSASADPAFEKVMSKVGFRVEVQKARAHVTSGGVHTIFLGRLKGKR